jgi:hypothetical protein
MTERYTAKHVLYPEGVVKESNQSENFWYRRLLKKLGKLAWK